MTSNSLFFVSIDNFSPLAEAAALLTSIAPEADVKISRTQFTIITTGCAGWFIAALHIWEPFFDNYYIDEDTIFSSRISLPALNNTLTRARNYRRSSMTMRVQKNHNFLFFEFTNSLAVGDDRDENEKLTYPRLSLSRSREVDLSQIQIDHQNFFAIHSNDFRRIITEFSRLPNGLVVVSVTNSQVKFSIPSRDIILTTQDGQSQIVGFQGEAETQFRIILHPTAFFLSLSTHSDEIWFHKTISNFAIITITTLECYYIDYAIHFPNI